MNQSLLFNLLNNSRRSDKSNTGTSSILNTDRTIGNKETDDTSSQVNQTSNEKINFHPQVNETPAAGGLGKKKIVMAKKPFDFNTIKILIRKHNDKEAKEVLLDRKWVVKNNNIPHFANVVKKVGKHEGVEITMSCNFAAFTWIIDFVKIQSKHDDEIEERQASASGLAKAQRQIIKDEMEMKQFQKLDEINEENCLNVLVTCCFLQLNWVYQMVWDNYLKFNFCQVINSCKMSLSNLNPVIVKDFAEKVTEVQLE